MARTAPILVVTLLLWASPVSADELAMTALPTFEGVTLADEEVTVPADLAGERNLVFLAFARKHQDDIDTWIEAADALQRALPTFRHYQMMPFDDLPKALRGVVLTAMRRTYPTPESQARYILLNTRGAAFAEATGLTDDSQTLQLLLDGNGQVLWSCRGPATEELVQSLREAAAR